MKVYQPDVFPFNILIATNKEFDKLSEFKTLDGRSIQEVYNKKARGQVCKVVRTYPDTGETYDYSLILFSEKPNASLMAHEAFHATCDLLPVIGVYYNPDDANEVYAYFIQYIVDCIEDSITNNYISWE